MDQEPQHGTTAAGRWKRRAARLTVAAAILGATAIAVMTLHERAGAGISARIAEPMPVAALPLVRQPGYSENRHFAGRIEPARQTRLGFERAGRVVEVTVREGDAVQTGDVIARLDTVHLDNSRDRLLAQRAAGQAAVELARVTDERQTGLTDRAVSAQRRDETRLQRAEAEARLAETEAALDGVRIDREKSVLRAPFGGTIAARHVDEGAIAEVGSPVADLLETAAARARIGLAPDVANDLQRGGIFTLSHRGRDYPARLAALRPDLDPASRTIVALFDLEDAPQLPYGDVIEFVARRDHDQPGYWVPLGALVEGTRGLWAIYTVADRPGASEITREAVRVTTVEGERAYVAGNLPDGVAVVRDGTHRVIPGQSVRVAALAE